MVLISNLSGDDVMKTFVLVFSMWGFDGLEWQYMGNQYVYDAPMTAQECNFIASQDNWTKFEGNPFYRISVECLPSAAKKT